MATFATPCLPRAAIPKSLSASVTASAPTRVFPGNMAIREFPSTNPGVGGTVLAEAGTRVRPVEREIIFNHQMSLPPRWVNQFQILIGREREETTSVNPAPRIVVQDAFTGGGAQAYLLRTENHVQLNDILTWSRGKRVALCAESHAPPCECRSVPWAARPF